MDWWIIALVVVALIALPAIGGAFQTADRTNSFADLGDISGMPIQQILDRVGDPTSISSVPDGQLYQWLQTAGASATHYAILVDTQGNAVGYTHQMST